MKKLTLIFTCIMLIFSLAACSGGDAGEELSDIPPAFSILQKQSELTKHSEKGESSTFSKEDFSAFLGEDLTYITVTALPEAEKGTLLFNGRNVMKGQSLPAEQLGFLKFVPNGDCAEASFTFTCDSKGYNGSELCCNMVFADGVNSPPVATDSSLKTVEGISCKGTLAISEPNGDGYTINVISYPADGFITVSDSGEIVYTPEEGFSGSDSMVYTVTDRFGAVSANATLEITVAENESGLTFADMQEDMDHLYAHRMCVNNVMVYRTENGNYYFDPAQTVSKMDFLVMMMNVAKLDADITAVADSVIDDDNGLSSGLKGYLSAAADKGIIKLENGRFSPKESITVADAAYMVSSALELPKHTSSAASSETADNSYSEALYSMISAGIIDASGGVIDPAATLTKAETAVLLCRIEDYMIENNMNR